MNGKFFIKAFKIVLFTVIGVYVMFLGAPFIVNPIIEKNKVKIADIIDKSTGLKSDFSDVKLVTTPKFTAGFGFKQFSLQTPENEHIFTADNFKVKMSLLPLLSKSFRIDTVQLDKADITLKFEEDGYTLSLLQYLPKSEEKPEEEITAQEPVKGLPFGLKLSDKLPDIHIGGYVLTVTDGQNNYVINGKQTDITDFIINKKVKISTSGDITLKDKQAFTYDIKLLNKIMPEQSLNDMIFNPQKEEEKEQKEETKFNVIEILEGLYNYDVTAKVNADLVVSKDGTDGNADITGVSVIKLPDSNAKLTFKGNSIIADSEIYTAENEKSVLKGTITTGEKPFADINIKSALDIANLVNLVKDVALIFNIKDLQTLTASGKLNADFNIKSDMKTVQSSGYLKVPAAKLYYGLYNIGVDNINADVSLDNNNINIKNAGFTVFSQPLKLFGTITQDAVCDLHLTANKLDLKGLLIALGQAAIMKENPISSGSVSADVILKGKADSIKPVVKLNIDNLNVKNIPSEMTIKVPETKADITSDGKTFFGKAQTSGITVYHPAINVNISPVKADIKESLITISQTPVTAAKIKLNIGGKITNYLTDKIGLDFVSSGDIKSVLKGDLNVKKQTLNLNYSTTDTSSMIIPGFDRSKVSFLSKVDIKGAMSNPVLSGTVTLPNIEIPEIPVKMTGAELKLSGPILNGSGTAQTFESGGIKAQNVSTDMVMKGNDCFLKNLKGSAFDGKFSGDVSYNIANYRTVVDFKGSGMNAEKAIEGAAGIKKALTGTLGFDAKLAMKSSDFEEMLKSLNGNVTFDVKKGSYGTIGKFQGLLSADNIITNTLLKNTTKSVINATNLVNTGTFDTIDGNLTLANGWATINSITSAGKGICYYVTGKYNIVNGTANVNVLGRLDGEIVSRLGVLGELSAEKLLSYIPTFGETTAKIYSALTVDPAGEKTSAIPKLTGNSKAYKDFKVVFNGGIESQSSVKSFKWISKADATQIDPQRMKDTVKDIKSALTTDVTTNVKAANEAMEAKRKEVTDSVNATKKEIADTKAQIKNDANELKNLFKEVKKQVKGQGEAQKTTAPTTTTQETKPASTTTTSTKPATTTSTTTTSKPAASTTTSTATSKPAATTTESKSSTTTSTTTSKPASTTTESKPATTTSTATSKPASTTTESKPATTTSTATSKPASTTTETKPAATTSTATSKPASTTTESKPATTTSTTTKTTEKSSETAGE